MPQIDCDIEDSVFYELGGQGDSDNRHELCQREMDLLMKNVNNQDMKALNNEGIEDLQAEEECLTDRNVKAESKINTTW